jgi:hypothetical protein
MTDQQRTGAIISLEDVFLSRDFGRRPPRVGLPSAARVDPSDPSQLEQVFLSEYFGHPEALEAPTAPVIKVTASPAPPTLVLLPGRGDAERDFTRYRGAIGAVSGVAAAALVVAGLSSGTGRTTGQPTISAEGGHRGHGSPHSGAPLPGPGNGGVATQPSTSGPTGGAGTPTSASTGSGGVAVVAQPATATIPATVAVVVEVPPPPPPPPSVAPPPPPPGGGTTPSPSPGGGSVLTPVFVTVGNTVSTVGATVTAASTDVAKVLPAVSPVTGLLSSLGSTVASLGQSVAAA